jgi:Asp-tRNA(Asn)/Glu-tRNA(Gln) amidotransferase C subunit
MLSLQGFKNSGAFSQIQTDPEDNSIRGLSTPKNARETLQSQLREKLLDLFSSLHNEYTRNLMTAFNLIQVASDDYLVDSAIKDLREDNQTLRFHNEALSDNLERSAQEYDMMAQHLDGLRVQNLVRVINSLIHSRKQESYLRFKLYKKEGN